MFVVPYTTSPRGLRHSLDRLFDDRFFDSVFERPAAAARSPALDVAETDAAYIARLEMPGVAKDDVKVSIDGRKVSVETAAAPAAKPADERDDQGRIVYRERTAVAYARSFTLPREVDQAASSAKLENGVLTLTLAKRGADVAAQLTVN